MVGKRNGAQLILVDQVQSLILLMHGRRVILDSDSAALYGVPTKRLNEQVRPNGSRFPEEFMFQITREEIGSLRSQNATLKPGRGRHRKYLPYAFTEHGAIMAATILNSPRAVEASLFVVRAFVKPRQIAPAQPGGCRLWRVSGRGRSSPISAGRWTMATRLPQETCPAEQSLGLPFFAPMPAAEGSRDKDSRL